MNKNEKFYNSFLSQEYRNNIFNEARIKRVTNKQFYDIIWFYL